MDFEEDLNESHNLSQSDNGHSHDDQDHLNQYKEKANQEVYDFTPY